MLLEKEQYQKKKKLKNRTLEPGSGIRECAKKSIEFKYCGELINHLSKEIDYVRKIRNDDLELAAQSAEIEVFHMQTIQRTALPFINSLCETACLTYS